MLWVTRGSLAVGREVEGGGVMLHEGEKTPDGQMGRGEITRNRDRKTEQEMEMGKQDGKWRWVERTGNGDRKTEWEMETGRQNGKWGWENRMGNGDGNYNEDGPPLTYNNVHTY